jgi:hypothetical protein
MTYAFIDESWLAPPASDSYLLVVAAVMTTDRRRLELISRRLKRVSNLGARSELKASASSPRLASKFLLAIAGADISIVAAMWRGARDEICNYETLYQRVVARCALSVVRIQPRIDLVLDKRYTNLQQQRDLEGAIRESIAVVPRNIVRIYQQESHVVKELAAPDFVAWALMEHYGRGNGAFYNLIRARIMHFDDLSRQK